MRRLILLILAPVLLAAVTPAVRDEAERVRHGRRIYREGTSPSGAEITSG